MKTDGKFIAGIVLIGLAAGVLVLGLVFQNQADFSRDYFRDQMVERGITFSPVAALMPAQQAVPCLVANAEKPLLTGKQAECYAKYQIGLDLKVVDGGKTYAQDHYNGYLGRVKAAAAVKADPNSAPTQELVKQSIAQDRISDDLLAGEATRGLLLTGYGFTVIGERLAQAALACFIIAPLLVLAGAALVFLAIRGRQGPAMSTSAGA